MKVEKYEAFREILAHIMLIEEILHQHCNIQLSEMNRVLDLIRENIDEQLRRVNK